MGVGSATLLIAGGLTLTGSSGQDIVACVNQLYGTAQAGCKVNHQFKPDNGLSSAALGVKAVSDNTLSGIQTDAVVAWWGPPGWW
ncbi:MAG: hypothetical protein R2867_37895 [Caldilineaceae bacterium]